MAFIRRLNEPAAGADQPDSLLSGANPQSLLEFAQQNNFSISPLDIERLAEAFGLIVKYLPMDDEISGILEKRPSGWVAEINAFHHPLRRRFTLAHELAHFILHREQSTKFEDEMFARRNAGNDPLEKEADRFAAELLMPEKMFREAIARGDRKLSQLSELFGASIAAVKFRADQLKLRRRSSH